MHLEIVFASHKVEEMCTSLSSAKKAFGGDMLLARSLLARINTLQQAETIKDITLLPPLRFHSLENKDRRNLKGLFAIDVKSRRDKWRVILQPLDNNKEPYDSLRVDLHANMVRIIEVKEVSNHYE